MALATLFALSVAPQPGIGRGLDVAGPGADTPLRPRVIDGDTVQTAEGVYHLFGVDAPELGQRCLRAGRWGTCGLDAAFALNRALGLALAPLVCTPVGEAAERPGTATCAINQTQDLAMMLLSQGLALALPTAPASYKEAEESARAGRLGIWSTDFVRPSNWRRGGRLPDAPVDGTGPVCPIKAMTTDDGTPIYLVPLDPGYDKIEDSAIVTRFCSDDAAEAEGWRRPPLSDPR